MKRMRSSMVTLFFLMAILLVSGCGADNTDTEGEDATEEEGAIPEGVTVTSSGITLTRNGNSLGTGGDETLQVNAQVADKDGRLLEDIPVRFRVQADETIRFSAGENTETSGNRFLTDATGTASILVSTPQNRENRNFDVVAVVDGTASEPLNIPVRGTSIEIDSTGTANFGQLVPVTATLTDSQGNPIEGAPLSFSAPDSTVIPEEVETDERGRASAELTLQATDSESLRVEGAGAQASKSISVTENQLEFTLPSADQPELDLNTDQAVEVRLTQAGTPQSGVQVDFATSRGTLNTTSAVTDADGVARVVLSAANNAGPAVVTAQAPGIENAKEFLFVATEPGRIDMQANPATLSPGEQSTVRASVRTADNQPVKGAKVFFTIVADDTGSSLSTTSAVTDEFGVAEVEFEAGEASGASEGVEIEGEIDGSPSVSPSSTTVTVGGDALFLTVGTGNSVLEDDRDTRYIKPYTVLVTDASGGPVEGASVTLEAVPTNFLRGFYTFDLALEVWVVEPGNSVTCDNEDQNRNGIMDPLEDVNGTGELEPGNVAAIAPQRVLTDQNGFAAFELSYPQTMATWVDIGITARAEVEGTETARTVSSGLPVLAGDLSDEEVPPPNAVSPFGRSTGVINGVGPCERPPDTD